MQKLIKGLKADYSPRFFYEWKGLIYAKGGRAVDSVCKYSHTQAEKLEKLCKGVKYDS